MRIEPTTDMVSIVLLGSFNPKIFHPAWLALNGLISKEQADNAEVNIVHTDITQFTAADISFDIQDNRFTVRCKSIHKEVIKDITLSAFAEHLPHTPVWQFGINRAISFSCGSEEIRNKFGVALAPKGPWGDWGTELETPESGIHGGMIRMFMRQVPRPDGLNGHIQADLRPSESNLTDVIVDINNHFAVGDPGETFGCADAMDLLNTQWQIAMDKVGYIVDGLMATVEELQ